MIKGIGLSNFRIFGKEEWLDLAPITVLTGPNSSGKSTILKALLLLKDSFKDDNFEELDFTGNHHLLAGFSRAKNKHSKSNKIRFSLPFHYPGLENHTLNLEYIKSSNKILDHGQLINFELLNTRKETVFKLHVEDYKWKADIDYSAIRDAIISFKEKGKKLGEYCKYISFHSRLAYSIRFIESALNYDYSSKEYFIHYVGSALEALESVSDNMLLQMNLTDDFKELANRMSLDKIQNNKPKLDNADTIRKVYFLLGSINTHDISLLINSPEELTSIKRILENILIKLKKNVELKDNFVLYNMRCLNLDSFEYPSPYDSYDFIKNNNINYSNFEPNEPISYDLIIDGNVKVNAINVHKDKSIAINNEFIFLRKFVHNLDYQYITDINFKKVFFLTEVFPYFIKTQIDDFKKYSFNEEILNNCKEVSYMPQGTSSNYQIFYSYISSLFEYLYLYPTNYIKNFQFMPAIRSKAMLVYGHSKENIAFESILYDYIKIDKEYSKEIKFLNTWLETFNISKGMNITNDIDGAGIKIKFDKELLAEKGYGIVQVLPIILKIIVTGYAYSYIDEQGARNYIEKTLYIEEPEANLHPNFQSKLAEMFVEANHLFNIQFILETHSEYLIRKIQYLVAKGKLEVKDGRSIEITPELFSIYYFKDSSEKSSERCYKINIKEDGYLDRNFGPGFFDEADNIAMELFFLKKEQNN